MRKPLSQLQFLDALQLVVKISGTGSTTPTVDVGGYAVTVTRSDNGGGTRNRTTITFKKPIFGKAPSVIPVCSTAGADFKEVSTAVGSVVFDAFSTTDGTTKVTDAVGTFLIVGPTVTKEGNY